MKSVSISLVLLAAFFSAWIEAAPVTARYLRFEGYYSSNTGQIDIYEIEAYANWHNVARNASVTVNSGLNSSRLIDGNLTSTQFSTSRTSPGPASEEVPHWIRLDFGSVQPIDRIQLYLLPNHKVSFGLFLSTDGVSWTQVGRYHEVSGMIQNDPTEPYVVIQSAAMRPGTTLMDVVYRVNDPDDATVKTRALAFVDGVRSFANVIRPVTFVEGTAAKLGDAIPANVDHALTWDVAADWDVDLGQIKFEVLAMDGRGLLPFDWITIPAAGGKPELTTSKDAPTDAQMLNALLWQYASHDTHLTLTNGSLFASSGGFAGIELANGTTIRTYGPPFIFQEINLIPASSSEVAYAGSARAGLLNTTKWHVTNRPYGGISILSGWGSNANGQLTIPPGLTDIIAIATGNDHSIALMSDGAVVAWGSNYRGQTTIPAGLSGVTAIAAGEYHSLALKSDGTMVAWGHNDFGQITIPADLSGVTAIAALRNHSLALKSDGAVVAWGNNFYGQTTIPANLSGVTAIATGATFSLALKSDGTVAGWGNNGNGQLTIPAGLSGVTAIAAGDSHSIALKSDGTVVGWGSNYYGETTIPSGLSGVIIIAACRSHNLALKSDGTVVGWGRNTSGQLNIPAGLSGVTAIAAGTVHNLALKAKSP
jgi:hypothetical protein